MEIIIWLVVGLVTGLLASATLGGAPYGIVGNIVLGIIGAFVGIWVFRGLGWQAPFEGLASVIAVAFVGAVIVLAVVKLFTIGRRPRAKT